MRERERARIAGVWAIVDPQQRWELLFERVEPFANAREPATIDAHTHASE